MDIGAERIPINVFCNGAIPLLLKIYLLNIRSLTGRRLDSSRTANIRCDLIPTVVDTTELESIRDSGELIVVIAIGVGQNDKGHHFLPIQKELRIDVVGYLLLHFRIELGICFGIYAWPNKAILH